MNQEQENAALAQIHSEVIKLSGNVNTVVQEFQGATKTVNVAIKRLSDLENSVATMQHEFIELNDRLDNNQRGIFWKIFGLGR